MIEDQSAQIFSGLSNIEGVIPSHHLSDIIFKLSMEPAGQRISGMGHTIAGLCGWKYRSISPWKPEACVEFVNRRQEVYGTKGTRWDSSENDRKWVQQTSILDRGTGNESWNEIFQNFSVYFTGTCSGITPICQAVTSDLSVAPPEGTIPFFDWYPAKDHVDVTARRAMEKEVFDGNLRWNCRVIVMDLLLLLEENMDSDPAKRTALLKQMFRIDQLPKDSQYEPVRANKKQVTSLWLFFVHFWEPALANFHEVFKSGSKDKDQEAKAVGEVCLVLGITCRTQWMQIGFLHSANFREYHKDSAKGRQVEYLPCRFDRLLSLLHERHSVLLHTFVRDIAKIFGVLIGRQTEARFDSSDALFPKEAEGEWRSDLDTAKSETENYFRETRHYLFLNENNFNVGFYARPPPPSPPPPPPPPAPPPPPQNGCDDPRKTANVYLFALLDVS